MSSPQSITRPTVVTHQCRRMPRASNSLSVGHCSGISRCGYPDGSKAALKCGIQARCLASRKQKQPAKLSFRRRWRETNNSVIMALAQQINLEPEWVSDVLYEMTPAKFKQLTDPKKTYCKGYRVPLVTYDTCNYYAKIFDRNRNVIFPMQPNALQKLIELLRVLDSEENKQFVDNGTALLYGEDEEPSGQCWIEPDISLARENGRRRRFEADNHDLFDFNKSKQRDNSLAKINELADRYSRTDRQRKDHDDISGVDHNVDLSSVSGTDHIHIIDYSEHDIIDRDGVYDQFMKRMQKRSDSTEPNYAEQIKHLRSIPMLMAAEHEHEPHMDENPIDSGWLYKQRSMRTARKGDRKHISVRCACSLISLLENSSPMTTDNHL